MFGQDWDSAEATIVARDTKFSGDGSVATHTYVADVRLPTGETFRATLREPTIATDFWPPDIRDVVSVLVRSKDRKVKFDKDDERLSVKAVRASEKQAFGEAQQQPAGTPAQPWTAPAGLPDAVAEKLAQLGIVPGTATQVFSGDSEQGQAALAAFMQRTAPVEQTLETRLLQLQALHDRGLLTAEEHAEQRRRILDQI